MEQSYNVQGKEYPLTQKAEFITAKKKKRQPTVAQRAREIEQIAAKWIYLQSNFAIKSTRKWTMERSTTDRTDESQFHGTENHSTGSHLLFDIPSPTWRRNITQSSAQAVCNQNLIVVM